MQRMFIKIIDVTYDYDSPKSTFSHVVKMSKNGYYVCPSESVNEERRFFTRQSFEEHADSYIYANGASIDCLPYSVRFRKYVEP